MRSPQLHATHLQSVIDHTAMSIERGEHAALVGFDLPFPGARPSSMKKCKPEEEILERGSGSETTNRTRMCGHPYRLFCKKEADLGHRFITWFTHIESIHCDKNRWK